MNIGINGMGRIGRLALRAALGAAERRADDPRAGNRLVVVHLNALKGGAAATAHLLAFDSVQGPWRADDSAQPAGTTANQICIDDRRLPFRPMPRRPTSRAATWALTWCWNAPARS